MTINYHGAGVTMVTYTMLDLIVIAVTYTNNTVIVSCVVMTIRLFTLLRRRRGGRFRDTHLPPALCDLSRC